MAAGLAGLALTTGFALGAAVMHLAGAAHDGGGHAGPPVPAQFGAGFERYASEMNRDMGKMMVSMHAPGYTGDADIDFLAMMAPHHQGAVDMARLVLIHGRDPATRRLAEDIIAGQVIEIDGMNRRLAMLRAGTAAAGTDTYPALGGTRGAASAAQAGAK